MISLTFFTAPDIFRNFFVTNLIEKQFLRWSLQTDLMKRKILKIHIENMSPYEMSDVFLHKMCSAIFSSIIEFSAYEIFFVF